jgi:3-dehydroquinate synthase
MTERSRQVVSVELGERSYRILIGHSLIAEAGAMLSNLSPKGKVAIVTDTNVARRYLKPLRQSLVGAKFQVTPVTLPPGERTKSLRTVSRILDELAGRQFERHSVLIALGGGVIGDVTGFASAIYLRGVPFVQIPTSLVAQVDSSVGGKTGVDHPRGKNLIGAFNQPRAVWIDLDTLRTLPLREWLAGLAEVIKYGVIADSAFFNYLEHAMDRLLRYDDEAVARIITRSCELKARIVSEDERESDRRRILNFGHTVGHALEALSGYRGFVHGEAVAIGMAQEADLARHLGLCDSETVDRLSGLIRAAGLPHELPRIPFSKLWNAMQSDKKVMQGTIYCVLPTRVGDVAIVPLERPQVAGWFAKRAWALKRPERSH